MDFQKMITETPECDNNVTDMSYKYYGRTHLIGSPVCGDNVVNMDYAYSNCVNLTGHPACSNNVITMDGTYFNCKNLNGSAVCGTNVKHMSSTYMNCVNLSENAYFHSHNVEYVGGCFAGKIKEKRLNIFVPANSITLQSCISEDHAFSLMAQDMTWIYNKEENYYHNEDYNIYVYPVDNVPWVRMQNNDY